MSLPSFDELFKKFQGKSQQGYLQSLKKYEDEFQIIKQEAESRYSHAQT
jgi:hypothetical protein